MHPKKMTNNKKMDNTGVANVLHVTLLGCQEIGIATWKTIWQFLRKK